MKQQSRCRSRSSFGATIFLVSLAAWQPALLLNAMETKEMNKIRQNLENQIEGGHPGSSQPTKVWVATAFQQMVDKEKEKPLSSRKDGPSRGSSSSRASSSSRGNSPVRKVSLEEMNEPHSSRKDGTAREGSLSTGRSPFRDNSVVRDVSLEEMENEVYSPSRDNIYRMDPDALAKYFTLTLDKMKARYDQDQQKPYPPPSGHLPDGGN